MKIRIEPYKLWSGGAKALGECAGILRATKRQVNRHGDFDVVINWGRSERRFKGEYINNPDSVATASDKLRTAEALREHGTPQPDYTTSRKDAEKWVNEGHTVVCRTLLRASEGRGIVLASTVDEIKAAPLYAKYVKKADEFRVHVAFGRVIDVQQKRRRKEVADEDVNWQIRNARFGWVFTRDGVTAPDCVRDAALSAIAALDLDFGAVDIGYNAHHQQATVYEVNTAPGLEGQTLNSYYEAFKDRLPQINGGAYLRRRKTR